MHESIRAFEPFSSTIPEGFSEDCGADLNCPQYLALICRRYQLVPRSTPAGRGETPMAARTPASKDSPRTLGDIAGYLCYYWAANGMVERFDRHMKTAIKSRLNSPDWMVELSWVLLGVRTALRDDLATSSAGLVYGVPLTVPGDFIPVPRGQQDPSFMRPFTSTREGGDTRSCPYISTRPHTHLDPKAYIIDYGGRHETVSVDRLKLAHLDFDRQVQLMQSRSIGWSPSHVPTRCSPDQVTKSGRSSFRPDHLQYSGSGGGGGVMWRHGPLNLRIVVYQLESRHRSSTKLRKHSRHPG
ncbi:hypothetical protein O3P69_014224 [Scylla paramamosain]|uniref:Uncharacterized protein n=1 Tax=Scylla paramamosain TaxID=85552 RepID=A0AAW0SHK0_SCYPA